MNRKKTSAAEMRTVSKTRGQVFSLRELPDRHGGEAPAGTSGGGARCFSSAAAERLCVFTLEAKAVYAAVKTKISRLSGHLDGNSLSPSTDVSMK